MSKIWLREFVEAGVLDRPSIGRGVRVSARFASHAADVSTRLGQHGYRRDLLTVMQEALSTWVVHLANPRGLGFQLVQYLEESGGSWVSGPIQSLDAWAAS